MVDLVNLQTKSKTERIITSRGYVKMKKLNHPRSDFHNYVKESVLVAEKVLKKYLPQKSVVHHINHIKTDNRPENLVICQDTNYHNALHHREIAFKESGNAYWYKCSYCHKWDDPVNLSMRPKPNCSAYHKKCLAKYSRERIGRIKKQRQCKI